MSKSHTAEGFEDPTFPESGSEGDFDMGGFLESEPVIAGSDECRPAEVAAATSSDEAVPDAVAAPLALAAPKKLDQAVPTITGGTVLDYAMSVDVDQRPAVALVAAMRKLLEIGRHNDEVVAFVQEALKHIQEVEGFSGRAKADLDEFLFGEGGVLDKLRATFATERELNRKAATGGLVDAAIEVEKLVEAYGNAKLAELREHGTQQKMELDRELHRITLSSLQSTLASIVEEKTSLAADRAKLEAANKYARRMGVAYAVAGLLGGLATAFGAIAFH